MLHHPRKYAASFLSQDRRFKPQKEARHAPHRTPHTAPHRTAPLRTAPHRSAPLRTAPHRTAPHRSAPHRSAPHRTAPLRTAPHRTHRTAPCPTHPRPAAQLGALELLRAEVAACEAAWRTAVSAAKNPRLIAENVAESLRRARITAGVSCFMRRTSSTRDSVLGIEGPHERKAEEELLEDILDEEADATDESETDVIFGYW